MSNNKQSSVEFILNNIHLKDSLKWQEIIEQAKAMHRQEIIDAYHTNPLEAKWQNKGFEYYNETYGGNNEN